MSHTARLLTLATLSFFILPACFDGDGEPVLPHPPSPVPGEAKFVTARPSDERNDDNPPQTYSDAGMASADAASSTDPDEPDTPPQGREDKVEEGEIYRIHDDKLFHLNTYRGLVIYDIENERKPQLLSRLPIFGYPTEMYFKGETAYVLVRDSLFISQTLGPEVKFQRHNVSQLIVVDLKDPKKPVVLSRFDVDGELREGTSRKVGETLYVVSDQPTHYWSYGWEAEGPQPEATAYVHSFDLTDGQNIEEVDRLQLFEGGAKKWEPDNRSYRTFRGVSISATSNALMVTERWWKYDAKQSGSWCSSRYQAESVVSLVDISDPSGRISVHSRFAQPGDVGDQFKQSYFYDPDTKRGIYLGIFAENGWSNCERTVRNSMVAIDVTQGDQPKVISVLEFGKPNETVRGSLFDMRRKVAYAITARAIDPLYAISFSDPAQLKVLSAIDGLSGDVNVFRPIGDGSFLMAVGRDNSGACTGFQDGGWASTRVAVSIFDARELDDLKLVQRRCIAVKGDWSSSEVNWNRDQAHKMLGMYSDQDINLIAVPVSYYEKDGHGHGHWWWYRHRSAVGMMRWDLAAYRDGVAPAQQQVLADLPTVQHPDGAVERTVFIKRKNTDGSSRRLMLTLSDSHMSFNDITDPQKPVYLSTVAVAPFVAGVYTVGDYVVEREVLGSYYGGGDRQPSTFRIKKAGPGGRVDNVTPLSSYVLGGVSEVFAFDQGLVVMRHRQDEYRQPLERELVVLDLRDPKKPRHSSTVRVPAGSRYGCWWTSCDSYNGVFRLPSTSAVVLDGGLALYEKASHWDRETRKTVHTQHLTVLDLRDPAKPRAVAQQLGDTGATELLSVVADSSNRGRFYLNVREKVGRSEKDSLSWQIFRHWARPYRLRKGKLEAEKSVNLPGHLVRSFVDGKTRVFVSRDSRFERSERSIDDGCRWCTPASYYYEHPLLRMVTQSAAGGSTALKATIELSGRFGFGSSRITNTRIVLKGRYDEPYRRSHEKLDYRPHLVVYGLSAQGFEPGAEVPLGPSYFDLMGAANETAIVSIYRMGLLTLDLRDIHKPKGVRFTPTRGWTSSFSWASKDRAYIAAGHYGTSVIPLRGPAVSGKL